MRQLLILVVSIMAAHAVAQEDFQHEPKITALVEPYLTHRKVNAVSVGVISNGQVWKKSFGHLDADGARSPDEKTIYEIGSISIPKYRVNEISGGFCRDSGQSSLIG